MAFNPKIDSPCPYRSQLAAVLDGDFCRMCQRTVFDLSGFDDAARRAFLAACDEQVCVSYKVPLRPAFGAAALAAAAMAAAPAAAQQPSATPAMEAEVAFEDTVSEADAMVIIVGGIKDPRKTAAEASDDDDSAAPELPVVYEDEPEDEAGKQPVASRHRG